ncbi:MAG: lactonase family protein [Chloroflexi bacterium]|nr:lactonase family protein [Chloroflexota bacterium]MBV9600827.1 lactonase family protein [Chloroflexota bacterium]
MPLDPSRAGGGAPPDLAFVGTYTRSGRSEGIHVFSYDRPSGRLTERSSIEDVDPSFLVFDPSHRFLFATSEGLTDDTGAVVSYAIDPTSGALSQLSRQPTGGGEPCHLAPDPTGRFLLVANHLNGSVTVFPVDAEGRIAPASHFRQHSGSGPGPTQQGPHAHHVTFDPPGQRVLLTDKGIDKVVVYQLDLDSGELVPNDPPFGRIHAGAAPRHLAFGRDGSYAYVNGEADMTLSTCTYDAATGALHEVQVVSTLPEDAGGDDSSFSTAEVAVDPAGRFVYVSNRGHHSIAGFAIDSATGRVSPTGHVSTGGNTPRHFAIHPSGTRLYVANQDSDTIVQFDVDSRSGELTPTGDVTQVGAPVCILFS